MLMVSLAAVLTMQASAPQQTPPPASNPGPAGPTMLQAIDFVRMPPIEFPARALSEGVPDGRVMVECTLRVAGDLADCVVVRETPPEMGFGAAVIQALSELALKPEVLERSPVGDRYRLFVAFKLAD